MRMDARAIEYPPTYLENGGLAVPPGGVDEHQGVAPFQERDVANRLVGGVGGPLLDGGPLVIVGLGVYGVRCVDVIHIRCLCYNQPTTSRVRTCSPSSPQVACRAESRRRTGTLASPDI